MCASSSPRLFCICVYVCMYVLAMRILVYARLLFASSSWSMCTWLAWPPQSCGRTLGLCIHTYIHASGLRSWKVSHQNAHIHTKGTYTFVRKSECFSACLHMELMWMHGPSFMKTRTHTRTHTHTHTHISAPVPRSSGRTAAHACTWKYVVACTHFHENTHAYKNTHTHTHISTSSSIFSRNCSSCMDPLSSERSLKGSGSVSLEWSCFGTNFLEKSGTGCA
jgi:hypothetical protein